MDETLLLHYNPETKQQSMEWRMHAPHLARKFPNVKIRWKILASVSWFHEGMLHIDYLPKGQTLKGEHYIVLLVQLKDILRNKPREVYLRVSCSCTKMPRLIGHFQHRRNCPT
jgi:hypothetical protein